MAETGQNLLGKLADAGEDAIAKVGEMPGLARVTQSVGAMRERLDDVQKRVRGLDEIERRLSALEQKVDELATAKATRPRAASGTRKTSSASKSSSAKKASS